MKRRNGSYREVMVVGLAGLVLTLMPTGGLRSAVAEESVQAARRQDTARPRSEDAQRPRGQDIERPRGEDVQRPRGEEGEWPRGHDRQA
jgi:hypothetical protein